MSDLIDRQAAIEIVDRYDKSHMILKGKPMLGVASIVIELEALPSAQPEHKTGHWIVEDNPGTEWYRITCSECGEDVTSEIPMIGWFPNYKALWDYCPHCGAKMEGEKDEE